MAVKVKCTNEECEHVWEYKGTLIYATCPSCHTKSKVKILEENYHKGK